MVTDGASALLASYNVHKCVGTDGKFDPDRIAAVIAEIGPDIIALQEADKRFGDRDALLDLDAINRATGLVPVAVQNGHSGHGWHGNLVLVREGLICALSQLRLPGLEPRGALVVDIDLVAGPVRVMAAHLGLLRHSRLLQIQALLAHATAEDGRPVVLMGDMNEWRLRKRSSLHPMRGGFAGVGDGCRAFRPISRCCRSIGSWCGRTACWSRWRRIGRRCRALPPTTCRSRPGCGSGARP